MQGTKVFWQLLSKLTDSTAQCPQEVRDGGLMAVLFPEEGKTGQ